MKILAGTHGTGKTRSLLLSAEKCEGKPIIFCANPLKMRHLANELGIENLVIKDHHSFWEDIPNAGEQWFVDDLASCLNSGVPLEGFTLNLD